MQGIRWNLLSCTFIGRSHWKSYRKGVYTLTEHLNIPSSMLNTFHNMPFMPITRLWDRSCNPPFRDGQMEGLRHCTGSYWYVTKLEFVPFNNHNYNNTQQLITIVSGSRHFSKYLAVLFLSNGNSLR